MTPRKRVNPVVKTIVYDRDGWSCVMCGLSRKGSLTVHHLQLRSQGGSDESENLITLCSYCHSKIHKLGLEHEIRRRYGGGRKCQTLSKDSKTKKETSQE